MRIALALMMTIGAAAQAQEIAPASAAVTATASLGRGYNRNTPVEKIAADPDGVAVLNKDMPGLLTNPSYGMFKSMSLRQLQQMSDGEMSTEDLDKTEVDLMALPPH